MFKLYDMQTRTLLLPSDNEEEIIEKMGENVKERCSLVVLKRENKTDDFYVWVRNPQEYEDYKNEYYRSQLQNKSCMELKREMMDIVYNKPKVKALKRK